MTKVRLIGLILLSALPTLGFSTEFRCNSQEESTDQQYLKLSIELDKRKAKFGNNSFSLISHVNEAYVHWSVFYNPGNFYHYAFNRVSGLLITTGYSSLSNIDSSNHSDQVQTELFYCEKQQENLL